MNDRVLHLRDLLHAAAPRTILGLASPSEVRRVRALLDRAEQELASLEAPGPAVTSFTLDAYRADIDRFNASQPNAPLLDAIRGYNHTIVDSLHSLRPLQGQRVLDVGASPHGYALERALALGAAKYIGIGLDVSDPVIVTGPTGVGELRKADAEALPLAEASIDLIVSMSTFEHVGHVDRVLREMWRVLKPGGGALVTFEPIWTASYGHHLHHFGPVSKAMPDWAHLLWSKQDMLTSLADVWPAGDPLTLAAAAAWVYDSPEINRVGIREMRQYFAESPMKVEWLMPLADEARDEARAAAVSAATGLDVADLTAKGLSVWLRRP
jgi:SAM-dependent methyltransferase